MRLPARDCPFYALLPLAGGDGGVELGGSRNQAWPPFACDHVVRVWGSDKVDAEGCATFPAVAAPVLPQHNVLRRCPPHFLVIDAERSELISTVLTHYATTAPLLSLALPFGAPPLFQMTCAASLF